MSYPQIDTWKEYGVQLEKTDTSGEKPIYFVSVPAISDFFDDMGNELSGKLLAKRVKRSLGDTVQLRCRVRQERWTQARAANMNYQSQQSQTRKTNMDDFVHKMREADERRKEENMRAFLDGLFGGYK